MTADWENYGPLVQPAGGFVAFHDIAGKGVVQPTTGHEVEVPALWARLLGASPDAMQEFVADGSKMGLGVIWPGLPADAAGQWGEDEEGDDDEADDRRES